MLFVSTRLIAALAFVLAAPAAAGGLEGVERLDITLNGTISEHCAIGSVADMDFGNLERRGLNMTARVAFDCNVPFTMTIKGTKGALTHTEMPGGQGPYSGAVPYSLAVELPVRHPSRQVLAPSFGSRQLLTGGVISSNGGIATDGMLLSVELTSPSREAGLLAGDYSETVTITVTPT